MKKTFLLPALAAAIVSCSYLEGLAPEDTASGGNCTLSLKFQRTKASVLPDTNSFYLSVTSSKGINAYTGQYGDMPDVIRLGPGTYEIKVVSADFDIPAFDTPQWGDSQSVTIDDGKSAQVVLVCRQLNSGVRLRPDDSFTARYADDSLFLRSSEGSLHWPAGYGGTAFFKPGTVRLCMKSGGKDERQVAIRSVAAGEILTLKLKGSGSEESGVSVQVDTSRSYVDETIEFEDEDKDGCKGGSTDNPFSIAEAKEHIGEKGVWVSGYIVGGDLTSKSMSFIPPFTSATNLALGSRRGTDSKAYCLAVQLPSGSVRDNLNLVSNPSLLGSYVILKGDISASYFGITGLKNVSEYSIP